MCLLRKPMILINVAHFVHIVSLCCIPGLFSSAELLIFVLLGYMQLLSQLTSIGDVSKKLFNGMYCI